MLRTRLITAIVAIAVFATVLFVLPAMAAEAAIALLVVVAAWEWSGFLGSESRVHRTIFVIVIALLMASMTLLLPNYETALLKLAALWWFCAFLWIFAFPTRIPLPLRWLCGALVLVPLYVALLSLYRVDSQLLLVALLVVWAADIGAYFAGRRFGRVKLAPSISPGKTWEGVIGGLGAVLLLAFGWASYRDLSFAVVGPFFLAVGALSVVGDLTVSMFKRTAGVKDSGKLFPGHGGVLDRIDSVAAAMPLFTLGLIWLALL